MTDYRGMDSYPHLKSVGTKDYIPYDRKWHNKKSYLVRANQDNIYIHPKKLPKLQKEMEEIQSQMRLLKQKERDYNEIINGDEDSIFYGLKTPSKYTIIKYIADKFNVCDDIADMLYKKFTQCLLKSEAQIGDTRCHDDRIKRQILRPSWTMRFLEEGMSCRADPDRRFSDYIIRDYKHSYVIPLLGDDVKLGFYGRKSPSCKYDFKYDDTKNRLIEICEKYEIDYKKSWKKDKIKNSIIEFINLYTSGKVC